MKIQQTKAFTLVELIIVITILAILATIGFMSYQSYTLDARDANRTTSLQEIGKGLELYQAKNSKLPIPTGAITITASGTPIGYQGIFGKIESDLIKMTSIPVDPIDNTGYIYSINDTKTKYQLLTYLENQTSYNPSITNQAYAIDYTNRKFKTFGDKLGIILNSDNSPISGNIETQTGTTNYNLVFSDTNSYTLSGNLLSVIGTFRGDKSLASLDSSLVGYWDMETLTSDGKLKDLSQYGNNGTCYNSGTAISCGTSGLGPQIVDGNGATGKAMSFDGVDDYINLGLMNWGNLNNFTFNVKAYRSTLSPSSIFFSNNYSIGEEAFIMRFGQIGTWEQGELTFYWGESSGLLWGGKLMDEINRYYNIVVSGDVINKKFSSYTDGIKYKSNVSVASFNSFIDKTYFLGRYLSGSIDEVKVYNRVLSDPQVKAIYDATK